MSLPKTFAIEIPILQELVATGGVDDVRYIYIRLLDYFPQIDSQEVSDVKEGKNENWRKIVQKAGKSLNEKNLIVRQRGLWTITERENRSRFRNIRFYINQTAFKSIITRNHSGNASGNRFNFRILCGERV